MKIFINYRREESAGHAGRLYESLAKRFGKKRIFMDIDTIEPGVDFAEAIEKSISSCDVFLALIGRQWLTLTDASGRRRIENSKDFVQLEIATALQRGVRVIPILLQKAAMPSADALPPSLTALARHNAIELSDTRWDYDVRRLVETIKRGGGKRPFSSRKMAIGGVLLLAALAAFYFGGSGRERKQDARGILQPASSTNNLMVEAHRVSSNEIGVVVQYTNQVDEGSSISVFPEQSDGTPVPALVSTPSSVRMGNTCITNWIYADLAGGSFTSVALKVYYVWQGRQFLERRPFTNVWFAPPQSPRMTPTKLLKIDRLKGESQGSLTLRVHYSYRPDNSVQRGRQWVWMSAQALQANGDPLQSVLCAYVDGSSEVKVGEHTNDLRLARFPTGGSVTSASVVVSILVNRMDDEREPDLRFPATYSDTIHFEKIWE